MELSKARDLCVSYMNTYGLGLRFTFRFDNSVRRFGSCQYRRVSIFSDDVRGVITLSKHLVLLNDEEVVLDTILHEIAHALTPFHGHDATWKRKCLEIGAKPNRCYNTLKDNVRVVSLRYKATCGGCGREFQKAKKPSANKRSCACQGGIDWDSRILLRFIDTKELILSK